MWASQLNLPPLNIVLFSLSLSRSLFLSLSSPCDDCQLSIVIIIITWHDFIHRPEEPVICSPNQTIWRFYGETGRERLHKGGGCSKIIDTKGIEIWPTHASIWSPSRGRREEKRKDHINLRPITSCINTGVELHGRTNEDPLMATLSSPKRRTMDRDSLTYRLSSKNTSNKITIKS